jgi:hypothetical protein
VRRRSVLLGLTVSDREGGEIGTVVDTWPFDGGGEPELAVLRLGRMGDRRMVPVAELRRFGGGLRLPYERWQVEDSPRLSEGRYGAEDPYRAQSYWAWEEPVGGNLRARCLRSSGSFGTARRSLTTPSPTPIAS